MSAEESQSAYPALDGELKRTLFDLCMEEVEGGKLDKADVITRMDELARVHSHGAKDVAAVALNPGRTPDKPVDIPPSTVRVDLLEKEK